MRSNFTSNFTPFKMKMKMTQVAVFYQQRAPEGTGSAFRPPAGDRKTFFFRNFVAVLNLNFMKIFSASLPDFPWPISFVVLKGTDSAA